MKIKTGDTVNILRGKDRGKQGKVIKVFPEEARLVVEKLNMVKKHLRPTKSAPHGGIQEVEQPLPSAAVMLVCPHCSKFTRVGHTLSGEGKNVRICRKCKEMVDVKK